MRIKRNNEIMSRHKPGHTMRMSEIRDSKKIQKDLLEDEEYDM